MFPNQGYPSQQPYPGAGYPPPPAAGGYPGGYPGEPAGYPGGGYPGGPGGYPGGPGGYPGGPGGYPGGPGGYPQQPYPGAGGYPPPPPQQPYPGEGYGQPDNNMPQGMYTSNFPEDGDVKGFDFSEASIRRAFIRKVYSILMLQLLVTLGFVCLFAFHDPTKLYVRRHPEMFWIAFVVLIVCLIAMACCESVRRKAPMNFIFLGLFTVAESFTLGVVASSYHANEVVLAIGITAAVCFALTIFAMQTKFDFTVMGGALLVIVVVFMIFGIVAIFYTSKIITLIYASIGALIFSIYLIYDTQLMMGGKHKYSISPEEYIFAALNLYLDIVNIFLYILTIIGASRD